MKQRDLVRRLTANGWWLDKSPGHKNSNHDIYKHSNRPVGTLNMLEVPRHIEIKEKLARKILKDAGL